MAGRNVYRWGSEIQEDEDMASSESLFERLEQVRILARPVESDTPFSPSCG